MNKRANWYNSQMQSFALVRAKAAADLRKSGKTWAEIGAILGVSKQRAHKIASRVA